jgi:hypothetical protein
MSKGRTAKQRAASRRNLEKARQKSSGSTGLATEAERAANRALQAAHKAEKRKIGGRGKPQGKEPGISKMMAIELEGRKALRGRRIR